MRKRRLIGFRALFTTYLLLSIYSAIPSKAEKASRSVDEEQAKIPEYSPESVMSTEQHWEKATPAQFQVPTTPGLRDPRTPRTVAFQALEGSSRAPSMTPSRGLPFREQYAPDGR